MELVEKKLLIRTQRELMLAQKQLEYRDQERSELKLRITELENIISEITKSSVEKLEAEGDLKSSTVIRVLERDNSRLKRDKEEADKKYVKLCTFVMDNLSLLKTGGEKSE